MADWKALTGRITLFAGSPASGALISARDLFQNVWQSSPDNFQSSPNVLFPSIAHSQRERLSVGCMVQPTRIDFNFNPIPPTGGDNQGPILALIEDTTQLCGELGRVIEFIDGFTVTNSVTRVGLFLQFLTLVPNIEEANQALVNVMPKKYRLPMTNEEDFMFQINRPNMADVVEGIKMNYVTRWNVNRFQIFNVAIAIGSPVVDTRNIPSQQDQEFIAPSVTFDFNNVVAHDPLNGKQRASLLRECLGSVKKLQSDFGLNIEGF